MIGLEVNDAVIVEQKQVLEQALSTAPKTRNKLQWLIRKAIMEARAKVVDSIKFDNGDPRGAARAVRSAVYQKILGANINIYNSKKAHGSTSYEPPRTLRAGQRGGNRLPRSQKTQRYMSYDALDRGFILRWVNDGMTKTNPRVIKFKANDRRKVDKWNKHPNTGNRGGIAARHFFKGAGERELVKAADNLANMIETEFETIMNMK